MKTPPAYKLRSVPIEEIASISPTVKSIAFNDKLCAKAKPGQFAMIWVPGKDDIPMSLTKAFQTEKPMIIVKRAGEATEELHKLTRGDLIGVKGPLGTSFKIKDEKKILCIAGGTGVTPFLTLIRNHKDRTIHLVLGAKTHSELLYYPQLKKILKVTPVTEDGSFGECGKASECLQDLVNKNQYDLLLGCGPELMIKSLIRISKDNHIPVQVSLERIMKCGVGVCGSCSLAGLRVCRDGPVFYPTELTTIENELGAFTRDHTGKRIPITQ